MGTFGSPLSIPIPLAEREMNKENRVGLAGLLAAAPESGGSQEPALEHARNRPASARALRLRGRRATTWVIGLSGPRIDHGAFTAVAREDGAGRRVVPAKVCPGGRNTKNPLRRVQGFMLVIWGIVF